MEYFLIDNGSLRAGSVLQMREIAQNLSARTGHSVRPFGLMHSHKVAPSELGGLPGQSMQEFLASERAEEVDAIRALPFFLGPSLAILTGCLKTWVCGKKKRIRGNSESFPRCTSPEMIVWPRR